MGKNPLEYSENLSFSSAKTIISYFNITEYILLTLQWWGLQNLISQERSYTKSHQKSTVSALHATLRSLVRRCSVCTNENQLHDWINILSDFPLLYWHFVGWVSSSVYSTVVYARECDCFGSQWIFIYLLFIRTK